MRTRDFLSALVIVSVVFGCSPKPAGKVETKALQAPPAALSAPAPPHPARLAVEEIQRQYSAEVEELVFPEPGKTPALGKVAARCKGFPRTLRSMRAFEQKHGMKNPEYAHVTVLKGMIHLHCGRFRSASAMVPAVTEAASLLSNPASGGSRSDLLFARNFKYLVTGWREIHNHEENLKARNAGRAFPFASADFNKIHQAADHIGEDLLRLAAENPSIIRDPQSERAGLYVAAVAATFYTWVQGNNDLNCAINNSEGCTAKKKENRQKAVFYAQGRDLIGLFLTESEKNSAVQSRLANTAVSPGRLRYLSWYAWLSQKVQEASNRSQKKGIASR